MSYGTSLRDAYRQVGRLRGPDSQWSKAGRPPSPAVGEGLEWVINMNTRQGARPRHSNHALGRTDEAIE
jgi:hypothetical protein